MDTWKKNKILRSPALAAVFLMATSAIGPGFLTQTALFTDQLLASFGFVILVSILLDIGAQLNVWKILCVSGLRAQELSNRVLPGAGYVLTCLVVAGGLAFNTGNLAGAGLGINVITGWPAEYGAAASAAVAVALFSGKESLKWMDLFARALGMAMILLTLYVVFSSRPPLGEALLRTVAPLKVDLMAIITLVGGTVGGYISFAGAHRLLDAGLTGREHSGQVGRSAVSAVLLASGMRALLFLAALGVVSKGLALDQGNPAASVFRLAAGNIGYAIFGVVMWAAAITSVVGSTYTSISFFRSLGRGFESAEKPMLAGFVLVSLGIFLAVGKPVKVLVAAGTLNGFILPIALGLILLASGRKDIVGGYRHPAWLKAAGLLAAAATAFMAVKVLLK